jgi:hypothetical protein
MAYLTELSNFIGNFLEQIVEFMINLHYGLFVLLAFLFVAGFIIILMIRLRDISTGAKV